MSTPIDILLVEDDPGDVLMTREAFEHYKIRNELHVATDGIEAVKFVRNEPPYENAPRPGLILLDLNMPRKDGREALAEIKADAELRDIPVVVLTASKADEDFWRARNLGADMYLVKPVTFETLVNVTRSLGRYWFEIVEIQAAPDPEPARSGDNALRVA